jgi:hypothetical protein
MIIRPTMIAATAVAARIVKNQYRRLPSSRKGVALLTGRGRLPAVAGSGRAAGAERIDRDGLLTRRCGESQGQMV